MTTKQQKWDQRYQGAVIGKGQATSVLLDQAYLLPKQGRVLDLACGRGDNAIFLAQHGLHVEALDLSPIIIDKLSSFACQQNLSIQAKVWNVEEQNLPLEHYDVIVVSYFLERDLFPQLITALKPNGLLFYQTWSQANVNNRGPNNPSFRLATGELLQLIQPLQVVHYQENLGIGNVEQGLRDEVTLVAQKR